MSNEDDILIYRRTPRSLGRRQLRLFAKRLHEEVGGGRLLSILLTDDRELRRLNRAFLHKDYPTDVLSFPPGEDELDPNDEFAPLGEMAISVERAREQAEEYGHSTEEEVCILMLHGLLHLMGLDHERDNGKMARTERQWRKKLGLPTGLIERAQQ